MDLEEDVSVHAMVQAVDESSAGWANAGNRYWTPVPTIGKLPAGVYDVSISQRIGVYLQYRKLLTDNLIPLPSLGTNEILGEIEAFWAADTKALFEELGFVHKRGVLLYGPPGTGKTSIVNQLIEQVINKFDGIVLPGSRPAAVVAGMQLIRSREPNRPILVILEDIDTIVKQDEEGLLNLLDGQNQVGGVVFLATTNYIDKLPPRIKARPSRFDLKREILEPDLADVTAYFRFVAPPVVSDKKVSELAAAMQGLPMAFAKEAVILTTAYKLAPEDARARLDELNGKVATTDVAPATVKV